MHNYLGSFKKAIELFCGALFGLLFIAFLLQIFTRYVLNDPLSWTMEVSLLTYLWIIFVGGGIIVSIEEHISFDAIYNSAKPKTRRIMALISNSLILITFLVAFPANADFINFMSITSTPVLEVPFNVAYFCFLIFMVAVVIRTSYKLFHLLKQDWLKEI